MADALLEAQDLCTGYDGTQVLWDVSLRVSRGEIVALCGSNGAGKTTLLRALSGILPIWSGRLSFEGRDITRLSARERVKAGIVQVPEGRQLFAGMTVRENLLIGAYVRSDRQAVLRDLEEVLELFPEIRRRLYQQAGTLSGGEQQMVAIGRALMARPKLLLVDELSLGLAPVVVDRLVELLERIHRERGVAILLVEQDLHLALSMAHRGYVMENGRVVRSGPARELLEDPTIQQAYLGV